MAQEVNDVKQPVGTALPGWVPPPLPPRQAMEGRFCRLEPLDIDAHAKSLYESSAGPVEESSWTYLAYGPFRSLDSYRAWMAATCLGADPLFFSVVDKADGRARGVAAYLRIQREMACIEVGHLHFSSYLRRTPAATEAMYLMMKQAFELGYRRYEWKCDALNAASRAAAQRLGLSYEGTFRQAGVYKGRNRVTAWFAAIDSEWQALEAAFTAWLRPDNFDTDGKQRSRLADGTGPILKRRG